MYGGDAITATQPHYAQAANCTPRRNDRELVVLTALQGLRAKG